MSYQGPQDRVRRCICCGFKTHHSEWINKTCPICGSCQGWIPTNHGQLSGDQIPVRRRIIIESLEKKKNNGGLSKIAKERLRWLLRQERKQKQLQ